MLFSILSFKDKQLNKFTLPSYSDLKDFNEIKEDAESQIVKSDKRAIFKGKDLYKIGTFDNQTGTIEVCDPEFILNCDSVISAAEDYERKAKN